MEWGNRLVEIFELQDKLFEEMNKKMDEQFKNTEAHLREDARPLKTMQEFTKLIRMFFEYLKQHKPNGT